jgi:dATP pyrophosphohydrolase
MSTIISTIVEVCVFRVVRNEPEYLLLKRSDSEKLYPGTWQIVTGMIRDGESALKAALREVREETGLSQKRFWTVPYVTSFYDPLEDAIHLAPMFAAEVDGSREPKLSSEHQSIRWCSCKEAQRILVWPGQRQGVQVVHDYIVGGEEVARLTDIAQP